MSITALVESHCCWRKKHDIWEEIEQDTALVSMFLSDLLFWERAEVYLRGKYPWKVKGERPWKVAALIRARLEGSKIMRAGEAPARTDSPLAARQRELPSKPEKHSFNSKSSLVWPPSQLLQTRKFPHAAWQMAARRCRAGLVISPSMKNLCTLIDH